MRKIKQFLGMGQSSVQKDKTTKVVLKEQEQTKEIMAKVVMFGDSGAGKSIFFYKWRGEQFPASNSITIGIDFMFKWVNHRDKNWKLQVWDTQGLHNQSVSRITQVYLKNTSGLVFVYDITHRQSFQSIKSHWYPFATKNLQNNPAKILIGTKVDLQDDRKVSIEEGKQLARSLGMEFIEVSSKSGYNVEKILQVLVEKIATNLDQQKFQIKPIKHKGLQVEKINSQLKPIKPIKQAISLNQNKQIPKPINEKKIEQLASSFEQQSLIQKQKQPKISYQKSQRQQPKSLKVILVGPDSSRKSLLWNFWKQDSTALDYLFKNITIADIKLNLQIFYANGSKRFAPATAKHFQNAKAIIFVYDIRSKQSFLQLKDFWYPLAIQNSPENTTQILIGNKSYLEAQRQVNIQEGIQLAESLGMQFVETSASNGANIQEALIIIAKKLIQKMKGHSSQSSKINHQKEKEKNETKNCQKKAEQPNNQLIQKNFEEKDKKISELQNKLNIEKEKAIKIQQEYQKRMRELQENSNKNKEEEIKEEEKKKYLPEKEEKDFYEILSENQVSDVTIQILKSEEIKSFKELKYFNNEELKALGIKMGEIARIRQIS